jgi:hypothetical protein
MSEPNPLIIRAMVSHLPTNELRAIAAKGTTDEFKNYDKMGREELIEVLIKYLIETWPEDDANSDPTHPA